MNTMTVRLYLGGSRGNGNLTSCISGSGVLYRLIEIVTVGI